MLSFFKIIKIMIHKLFYGFFRSLVLTTISLTGFLFFYVESLSQLEEKSFLEFGPRLIGFLILFLLPLLTIIPSILRNILSAKHDLESPPQQISTESSKIFIYQSIFEIVAEELRSERARFLNRRRQSP